MADIHEFAIPFSQENRSGIRLHHFRLPKSFRSLSNLDVTLRLNKDFSENISPVCFVGLNGSGKSNLIELFGAILCDIELWLLGYKGVKHQTLFPIEFDLQYVVRSKTSDEDCMVRITKSSTKKHAPTFHVEIGAEEFEVVDVPTMLSLLPTRVVAYSSGLNETISVPFLRSQAFYSEEVLRETQGIVKHAQRIRTIFLDEDYNSSILVANYVFAKPKHLELFKKRLRISDLDSFSVSYRLKRKTSGRPVDLTESLKETLASLRKCATEVIPNKSVLGETFRFEITNKTKQKLRKSFVSADQMFDSLHRWSQLNSLALTGKERKFYRRTDSSTDMLSRPPEISVEDRIFRVHDVNLKLDQPRIVIPYAGLSDGEHQFMQVVGAVLLFADPGSLFLFDEPETHFNPKWRRHFVDDINSSGTASSQEIVISTHSPFVVSGCHRDGIFRFKRKDEKVEMNPVGIETFGTSFELLLAELFDLEAMISEQAVAEMRKAMKGATSKEVLAAANKFGESLERRFLFEKAAELAEKENKK